MEALKKQLKVMDMLQRSLRPSYEGSISELYLALAISALRKVSSAKTFQPELVNCLHVVFLCSILTVFHIVLLAVSVEYEFYRNIF